MSKSDHHSIPPDPPDDYDSESRGSGASKNVLAHFIKDGVTWVKCPKCKAAQPLYQKSDDYPDKGIGGPYTIDNSGHVHPEFVCMKHVNARGHSNQTPPCMFSGVVRLGR